jgi:hypothetical protein
MACEVSRSVPSHRSHDDCSGIWLRKEGQMIAWEDVGRRKLAGECLRDGGAPVRWVLLWSALGFGASAVLLSAGFDLGAVLLLLE